MSNFRLINIIILIRLAATLVTTADEPAKAGRVEPPFPQMFSSALVGQHKIHITSELVSDESGYQSMEEFVDLKEGRQALIMTNRDSHTNVLVDSSEELIYTYRPYTCETSKAPDAKISSDALNNWRTLIKVEASKDHLLSMYLYGVAGLWTFAAEQPKEYSYGEITYSATHNCYRKTHKWTIRDDEAKLLIHVNFLEVGHGEKKNLDSVISNVQIESLESKRILRTINVLSVDYMVDDELFENILQVPVGYGCKSPQSQPDEGSSTPTNQEAWLGEGPRKLELEFTATRNDFSVNPDHPIKSSDTMSIELALGSQSINGGAAADFLQLIRRRNSREDIKTIISLLYNTKYTVDLRKGTCQLSHVPSNKDKATADFANEMRLNFANGLSFSLDFAMISEIFFDNSGFEMIKSAHLDKSMMQYNYQEKTTSFYSTNTARIVRTYINEELFSVTVWILDSTKSKIVESYHINVIEMRLFDSVLDLPKVFDVSEECYFNNEQMKAGKDYVWLEFHYDVLSRYLDALARSAQDMKRIFYSHWVVDYFRSPRMELMFNDDGFVVRILLIDIPPLETVYYTASGELSSSQKQIANLDAFSAIPDLSHCADICRLHSCQSMSFCSDSHKCLISNKPAFELEVNSSDHCKLLSVPENRQDLKVMFTSTLHQIVGTFQAVDYTAIAVPKMPDELVYPRQDTGVDEETYHEMVQDYNKNLIEYLSNTRHQTTAMSFTVTIDERMIILMPSKFEVESDFLSELSLADDTDILSGSERAMPPFHEGRSGARYSINSFNLEQRANLRLFSGLTYDQCALACVDGRCSSFSFCNHRQECVLTNFGSVSEAQMKGLIDPDIDCLIAQRDFLANFNKFPNVYRPSLYTRTENAHSPSECAYSCVTSSGSARCLAFSYCAGLEEGQPGTCFYQKDRYDSSSSFSGKRHYNLPADESTGCDHYARSYLADFDRIEGREIEPEALSKFRTTTIEGKTVFDCANSCVNELTDCSAFQFCFEADKSKANTMQQCTLIEGKAKDAAENASDLEVEENEEGTVIKAGKLFKVSANCHLFSLRRDTPEAHLRELALGVNLQGDSRSDPARRDSGGMTIWKGILLYLVVAAISAAIGCGVCVAKERNAFVRNQWDRLRSLVRA